MEMGEKWCNWMRGCRRRFVKWRVWVLKVIERDRAISFFWFLYIYCGKEELERLLIV